MIQSFPHWNAQIDWFQQLDQENATHWMIWQQSNSESHNKTPQVGSSKIKGFTKNLKIPRGTWVFIVDKHCCNPPQPMMEGVHHSCWWRGFTPTPLIGQLTVAGNLSDKLDIVIGFVARLIAINPILQHSTSSTFYIKELFTCVGRAIQYKYLLSAVNGFLHIEEIQWLLPV